MKAERLHHVCGKFFIAFMLMFTCIIYSLNAQTGSDYEGNGIDWIRKNIYIDSVEYKVFDKTGLVIVDEVTIKGSGNNGAFIDGRTVTLNPFAIGKYLVTQELYEAVMGESPFSGKADTLTKGVRQELRPAETLDFYKMAAFCNALSRMQGLQEAYKVEGTSITVDVSKNGWRLPTEAEWECAARGGDSSNTSVWNNVYAGAKNNKDGLDYAWVKDNSGGNTHEVGLKKANSLGLYDMLGNVYEWCLELTGDLTKGSFKNPIGAASGTDRVQRCCGKSSSLTDVKTRDSGNQSKYWNEVGFRLCRTLTRMK